MLSGSSNPFLAPFTVRHFYPLPSHPSRLTLLADHQSLYTSYKFYYMGILRDRGRVSPIKNACGSCFMGYVWWNGVDALSLRWTRTSRTEMKMPGFLLLQPERRKEERWLNDGEKRDVDRRERKGKNGKG